MSLNIKHLRKAMFLLVAVSSVYPNNPKVIEMIKKYKNKKEYKKAKSCFEK